MFDSFAASPNAPILFWPADTCPQQKNHWFRQFVIVLGSFALRGLLAFDLTYTAWTRA